MSSRSLALLALLVHLGLCSAQSADGPIVFGRAREVSVGPDRSIWLTTGTGNIYRTAGIDSLWKEGLQMNQGVSYADLAPHFDHVLFFSKDTAVVYGYIGSGSDKYDRKCVLRTVNGGREWSPIKFGEKDQWVRDGQVLGPGVACISTSKGRIFRTTDHGATWTMLPRIFKREREAYYRHPDIVSFHYQNDSVAIATNRSNHLAVSSSDFATSKRIPSPLDQGLFERAYKPYYLNGKGRKYVNNWSIDKVRIFGDHYVIMQNGKMYHTERDTIRWKEMGAAVLNFEIDPVSGRLYAITADQGVGEVGQDFTFRSWAELNSGVRPSDMRVLNDEIYLLFREIFDATGRDVVSGSVGLKVTEQNFRNAAGYSVLVVTPEGVKLTSVRAK